MVEKVEVDGEEDEEGIVALNNAMIASAFKISKRQMRNLNHITTLCLIYPKRKEQISGQLYDENYPIVSDSRARKGWCLNCCPKSTTDLVSTDSIQ